MKVMCVEKTSKNLDLTEVTNVLSHRHDYQLDIGREYLVMGLMLRKDSNCIHYLLDDDDALPRWYPYVLFEVTNNKLPSDWYMNVLGKSAEGDLHTLIGFKELCTDENFHDDLISEREEYALQTYFKRKEEIFHDYFG